MALPEKPPLLSKLRSGDRLIARGSMFFQDGVEVHVNLTTGTGELCVSDRAGMGHLLHADPAGAVIGYVRPALEDL